MESFKLLLAFAVAFLATVNADPMLCQGLAPPKPPNFQATHDSCIKTLDKKVPASSEEKKMLFSDACFMACAWESLGIVSTNGTLIPGGLATFVDGMFPAIAAPAILNGATACFTAAKGLQKTDNCASYKGLFDCFWNVARTVCDPTAAPPAAAASATAAKVRR